MSTYIPESLKTQIQECDSEALLRSADRYRCCYCLTSEGLRVGGGQSVVGILIKKPAVDFTVLSANNPNYSLSRARGLG